MKMKSKLLSKKSSNKTLAAALAIIILVFFIGFIFGTILNISPEAKPASNVVQYPYLAKRVQIDNPNQSIVNFTDLRLQIENEAKRHESEGNKISLYFEYLPTGVSIETNSSAMTVGASLMKLPVVMNLYKAAELGRLSLDSKVALKGDWLNSQYGTLY